MEGKGKGKLTIDYNKKKFTEEENEQIKMEANHILNKYPGYVPIICSSNKLKLEKHKYVVNRNLTFSEFVVSIRKKINKLNEKEGLFFLTNNVMVSLSLDIGSIYEQNKDKNTGILQIWITKENMFGEEQKL